MVVYHSMDADSPAVRMADEAVEIDGSTPVAAYLDADGIVAYDPRLLFSWPNSQISVMGGEQAAKTLTQIRLKVLERRGKTLSEEDRQKIFQEIGQDYREKASAYYSTSEMWDDGIIDPADTRKALGISLSAALNREFQETSHGVLRI